MVTTPGINPAAGLPALSGNVATKFDIYTVQFQATRGEVIFGTEAVGSNLSVNDTFQVSRLRVQSNLVCNQPPLTLATDLVFTVKAINAGSVALGAANFITATVAGPANFPTNSEVIADAGYMWLLPQAGTPPPTPSHAPQVYPTSSPARGYAQWT